MWMRAKEIDPSLADYAWPPRGPEAEKTSFRFQCDRHITEFRVPSQEEITESDSRILPLYLKFRNPKFLETYDRVVWSDQIDEMKRHIKPEASPGVPFSQMANRNDQVLEAMGERFNAYVLDRIEALLALRLSEIDEMDRKDCIDAGLMDIVRVFVKNEPHKVEKVRQGRVRLIMSVSLADKMIEMLLIRHLCKLEIANWKEIPSKPGIGFSPEDNDSVFKDIAQSGLPMAKNDMSGYDWSIKEWMIKDEAENRIKLCENPSNVFKKLIRAKAILESKTVFQFSDGTIVTPNYKGIVNSGKFATSRGNSAMRVRMADLVGSRKTIAAGDDCVESFVPGAVQAYSELGMICREYETVGDSFEFCSRVYEAGRSYPVNANKMVMNLLHQEPRNPLEFRMTMIGFEDELGSHPEYRRLLELIEAAGYYEVEGPHYLTESSLSQDGF